MSENTPKKVITRFAPSPTGFMHVGGVRTALFAWLFAQKNNGTFILRIEDTDKEREVPGSIEHIIKSLKWLGINWNEGPDIGGPNAPYIQSQRLDTYKKYAQELYEKGLAYADPYTKEELETFRKKSEENKKPFLYREYRPENPPKWDGTQPLRLRVKEVKRMVWNDLVRGELSAGPEALDDFILMKSDGYPTYNFAHIIDDLYMGVTHIFRADEFISSTPKFLALYEALGITRPEFATLPPILGENGNKKLGKRDGAKDVLDYKAEGFLPEAIVNFLAFIGWNPGDEREVMSIEEITKSFNINQIQSAGGKFNEDKLIWTNKEYLKRLPTERLEAEISEKLDKKYTYTKELLTKIIPIITERINTFGELERYVMAGEFDYFFKAPEPDRKMLIWKKDTEFEIPKNNLQIISEIIEKISDTDFTEEKIKIILMSKADELGKGSVLWPLRVSLSGKEKSPDPFTLLSILGKSESLKRIERAIQIINKKDV
jgi:glutamyl-tRNA synthetase